MNEPSSIDGVLVQWGDRLFYPGNRMVRSRTRKCARHLAVKVPTTSAATSRPPFGACRW